MRIQVSHETVYRYGQPARGVIQTLRLTPRNHESQYVLDWRIDVSENCQVDQHEDAFGNITHVFNVDGPLTELRILAEGEIDTQDAKGVVRGGIERFPPSLYLRETPLTHADPAIAEFAALARKASGDSTLSVLHALLEQVHEAIEYDEKSPTTAATTAAEVFALKRGVCQDFTHVFIAAARSLAIPARYIGGHFQRRRRGDDQEAGHAWAEAYVPDLGWDRLRCRRTASARPTPMSASRSGWIYLGAVRRCAAPGLAAVARRSMWRCASGEVGGGQRQSQS
jgi:transglutaminase-like putative cysteine protease